MLVFFGQLFILSEFILVSFGPISGLAGPVAVARGVAGKNNFHEKCSPEFRHLKTIFPIFFGQLFFRILVSFGPISGLAGPVAVARGVTGKNNFHEKFSPEFRHLKTIFPIFFGQLFFRILVSFGPISGLAGPVAVARGVAGENNFH